MKSSLYWSFVGEIPKSSIPTSHLQGEPIRWLVHLLLGPLQCSEVHRPAQVTQKELKLHSEAAPRFAEPSQRTPGPNLIHVFNYYTD